MARSHFSFEKRRKELEKKKKKEAKREARAERRTDGSDAVPIVELDEWGNPILPEPTDEVPEDGDEAESEA